MKENVQTPIRISPTSPERQFKNLRPDFEFDLVFLQIAVTSKNSVGKRITGVTARTK